jgi:hypothetical protein
LGEPEADVTQPGVIAGAQTVAASSPRRDSCLTLLASLLAALAVALAGCGSTSPSTPASPRPAVSATALPGLTEQDRKADPAAFNETALREVDIFIKDGTPRAKKLAMAERIAAMPEVAAYTFVTKAEALARFRKRFGERITKNLPVNPLPASFQVLVREIRDVARVAGRFYDDPIVDNDPGTHNGVKRVADPLLEEALPNP